MITNILVIVGHTGSGKTTLAEHLSKTYGYPMISFGMIGKKFAKSKGYNRLRDIFGVKQTEELKKELNECIVQEIVCFSGKYPYLIAEGIISEDVIFNIKTQYPNIHLQILYLEVSLSVRLTRISKRLHCSGEEAVEEEHVKDKVKQFLGINNVLKEADYVIDGEQDIEKIIYEVAKSVFI